MQDVFWICYNDALGIKELNQGAKCCCFFNLCSDWDNTILRLWRMSVVCEHLGTGAIWSADVCRLDL